MIRDFDVHVYYDLGSRAEAAALRDLALKEFVGRDIHVSRMVDRPIGPHPKPMFEIIVARTNFAEIVFWLMKNRGSLAVLVHEVTDHDTADHTAGAIWMGEKLELDFSQFTT